MTAANPTAPTRHPSTAVVLGGSLGGMLAAAAVRPHVDRVVVLERDALGPVAAPRPGTPQATQAHGLLPGGRAAMETLLPGVVDDLFAAGGISYGDFGLVGRWWIGGGELTPAAIDEVGLGISRQALETVVRRRARELPGVEVRDSTEVCGLLVDDGRCRGVRVRPAGSREWGGELHADLVLDTSGRQGLATRWLSDLGLPAPREERVDVDLRYVSARVPTMPRDHEAGIGAHVSSATRATPRGGVAIIQEDDCWVVALFGYRDDHPPTDPDGWRAFASTIDNPTIADFARRPLLTGLRPFGYAASIRRRYDRLPALPRGLAVLGDAYATFSPSYGQGMSIAAMQAAAVRDELTPDTLATATRRLQRRIATISSMAWDVQRGNDMRIDGVTGPSAPGDHVIGAYVAAVQRTARHDPVVAAALLRVIALLAPPASLLSPPIARRVWRGQTIPARSRRRTRIVDDPSALRADH